MYFCCWFQERAVEWIAGDGDAAPLLITFEENARGIHFDAVEVVFIMGMPSNPSTYLHLAGRTGRQPVLDGTVVTGMRKFLFVTYYFPVCLAKNKNNKNKSPLR